MQRTPAELRELLEKSDRLADTAQRQVDFYTEIATNFRALADAGRRNDQPEIARLVVIADEHLERMLREAGVGSKVNQRHVHVRRGR